MSARCLFHRPIFLLALTALLTAVLVQSGELGTADTTVRLQTTHSLWTSEPPVDPRVFPEFAIHGRDHKLYSYYGIGQSLLMLPADILGAYIEKLPAFQDYGDDPTVRDIVVTLCTSSLICILTVLVCYYLLGLLAFTPSQRIAGILALLFCTTFLHYTQSMTENNYIFLLTLTGLTFQYKWLLTGSQSALLAGSTALGLNLLTRLTSALDLLAVALFVALLLVFTGSRRAELRTRLLTYVKFAVPVYMLFGLIDRLYQHHRFGSYFNTYIQIFGKEQKMLHPGLPAAFPFDTPFHVGFFGALFKPEKSIFLFDPLLLLTLLVVILAWKRFQPEIRAYLIAFTALLFAYISFYAKYTDWSGDFAWGDRYVSTSAQILAFISVPLLMRYRAELSHFVWRIGIALIGVSVAIQLSSVMFWCPLEIYQMETLGHPTFVIALRFKNILAFSLGKMDQWHLVNQAMKDDPWDYVHITTFNFLPFLLARVGAAATWVVRMITVLWFAVLAATLFVLNSLRMCLRDARSFRRAEAA